MNFAPDTIPDSISYEALFYFWLNRMFKDLEAEQPEEETE